MVPLKQAKGQERETENTMDYDKVLDARLQQFIPRDTLISLY